MEKLIIIAWLSIPAVVVIFGFLGGAVANLFGFGFWMPALIFGFAAGAWQCGRVCSAL